MGPKTWVEEIQADVEKANNIKLTNSPKPPLPLEVDILPLFEGTSFSST